VRGNPHAAFDVAGAGNVAWSRWCDTRRRKGETTGNTNFDLNRRASPRPYLGAPGGEIPPGDSTCVTSIAGPNGGAQLYERWRRALRDRQSGSGLKPPQAAVVKSDGGERCGNVGT
jgi:hypothetical protein